MNTKLLWKILAALGSIAAIAVALYCFKDKLKALCPNCKVNFVPQKDLEEEAEQPVEEAVEAPVEALVEEAVEAVEAVAEEACPADFVE